MSRKESKEVFDCFTAMDKIAACASRMIRGTKSTPGFCSQQIEDRLQANHAAMDFSAGNGGKIVSDPQEAALIARTSYRNRPFSQSGCTTSPPGSSKSSLEDHSLVDVSNCFERWFRPGMAREQANSALFPHRHTDGVFIIRSCSRKANDYVLSFTSRGKIVHAQIVRVSHGGKSAFSLDGAKTKFPNLEHLVDFHKMNCGPLPTTLNDINIDSIHPSPGVSGRSVSGFSEFNNNCNSDMGHFQQQLEHDQHEMMGDAAASNSS